MNTILSIPPNASIREHIISVLMMLEGYRELIKLELLPHTPKGQRIIDLVEMTEAGVLQAKLEAAPSDVPLVLEEDEAVRLSACLLLHSHLLLGEEGEKMFELMYEVEPPQNDEDAPHFYHLPTIRKQFLLFNEKLMIFTDKHLWNTDRYVEMKAHVAALMEGYNG